MRAKDMTAGRPLKLIIGFALPMMAGNICQQLYTMVDAAFVGQFAGIQALAAVGAADWFNWLVLGGLLGFTQGFSVLISQYFGAGEQQSVCLSVGQSVALTGGISLALLGISQALVEPVLALLKVPSDIAPQARTYLRILFGGLPILGAYNCQAAMLRAVGDSKTPLAAMVVASVTNIILDALFVVAFRWGVAGASAATVIAQGASALYCLASIRKMPHLRFGKKDMIPHPPTIRRLLSLGAPAALQNTVIGVGGMAVQRVINSFGEIFIAGFTATNKIYGLLEMAATSYGAALASYTGQNYGARRMKRIREGVDTGAWLSIATALAISAVLFFLGRPILSLFVEQGEAAREQVLDVAQRYLRFMLAALPLLYLLYVYRSALQGMGDALTPMLSGLAELAMRVGAAMLLPLRLGEGGLYFAEPLAWLGAVALLLPVYKITIDKNLPKEAMP